MKPNKAAERYSNTDDAILVSKILDAIDFATNGRGIKFSDFLDMRQRSIVKEVADFDGFQNICFFGGYDDAGRVIASFYPDYINENEMVFPIATIKITYYRDDPVTHRDILGALIGLGVKREAIGDIAKIADGFFIFIRKPIDSFILSNFVKAGRYKVTCSEDENFCSEDIVVEYKDIKDTVSSNRLDCIVSAICNISRSESSELIKSGLVFLNSAKNEDVTYNIKDGDILSVRGYGKFRIDSFGKVTRKGRISLTAKKYI